MNDDVTDLRRCIRDLAAINALPLLWVGQSARDVVGGFLDALLTALRLDFAYARISDPESGPLIEAARVNGSNSDAVVRGIAQAVVPVLGSPMVADVAHPSRSGNI